MGKFLIIVGIVITVVGIVLYFFPNALTWFGRLPGDIRIENEHSKVFIPITTMVLMSALLSLIMYIIRQLK